MPTLIRGVKVRKTLVYIQYTNVYNQSFLYVRKYKWLKIGKYIKFYALYRCSGNLAFLQFLYEEFWGLINYSSLNTN